MSTSRMKNAMTYGLTFGAIGSMASVPASLLGSAILSEIDKEKYAIDNRPLLGYSAAIGFALGFGIGAIYGACKPVIRIILPELREHMLNPYEIEIPAIQITHAQRNLTVLASPEADLSQSRVGINVASFTEEFVADRNYLVNHSVFRTDPSVASLSISDIDTSPAKLMSAGNSNS